MGNILTVDGTFRKERENCLQGHKWTFTVKTCSLNSPVIFLHGKWLVKLQWKILPKWELGHETSVSCMYRPVPDECHELMIGGSIFFEIEWQFQESTQESTGRCEERMDHSELPRLCCGAIFWGSTSFQTQNCKCVCCQRGRHLELARELQASFLWTGLSVAEFSLARAPSCHK